MSLCEPTDPSDVAGRLNYACQLGHTSFVQKVVDECNVKNFDMLDHYGSPPLYNVALKNDNPQLVAYLLKHGATVGLRNADNETPLFIAVFNNRLETAKLLIEHGAKIEESGGVYGDYPIHVCVKNNHPTMLNLLLSHSVNVNSRNDKQETPLFLASKLDRKTIAYTLLMNKANKSLSSEGKDCLYIASEKKHTDITKLLKAAGPAELMQVKHAFQKVKKELSKKDSWQEVAFQRELHQLGISEDQAGRKPRELPRAATKPKKSDPRLPKPLFDSDEDDDEREARLKREEQPAPQRVKYQDPRGTVYNPTGAAHIQDVQKAKEAFKNYTPSTVMKPKSAAPPPGLVQA